MSDVGRMGLSDMAVRLRPWQWQSPKVRAASVEASYEALGHVPHVRASSAADLAASLDVLCRCLRNNAVCTNCLRIARCSANLAGYCRAKPKGPS
jgi:hypothetical protein